MRWCAGTGPSGAAPADFGVIPHGQRAKPRRSRETRQPRPRSSAAVAVSNRTGFTGYLSGCRDAGAADTGDAARGAVRAGGTGGTTGDRAAGATGTGRTRRTTGDHAAGAVRTGLTGRTTGNAARGTTGTGSALGATGNAAGGAVGPGRAGGTAGDRAAGAVRPGHTTGTTGDLARCTVRTDDSDVGTRGAVGVHAGRRGRRGHGHRAEGEGRSSGAGKQCWGQC